MEKEKDRYQCQDPGTGIEKEISSHDTRNGSACPNGRDFGIPVRHEVDKTRSYPAENKEDKIPDVTDPVLDIVSEDIEKPHVSEDVKQSSMKKHGGEKGKPLLECGKLC